MAGRAWTEDDDEALRQCVAEGLSIMQTSVRMGRADGTVKEHAKQLGLSWARAATIEATAALRHDEKQRRAAFRTSLMGDLERLKAQLFAPVTVYNFGGKDNTFEEAQLDQPGIADQLRLVQAINSGIATIERLENMDADEGLADVAGMLDQVAEAIKVAAEQAAELI